MAESPNRTAPTQLGTSASAIVTAGAASTWKLVRSLVVCNEDAATAYKLTLGIHTSASDTAGKRLFRNYVISPESTEVIVPPLFVVLLGHATTPDILYGLADVASKLTIYVGYVDGP